MTRPFTSANPKINWGEINHRGTETQRRKEEGERENALSIVDCNAKVAFGTTDVAPIVQGIIESKADGLYAGMNPETTFGVFRM